MACRGSRFLALGALTFSLLTTSAAAQEPGSTEDEEARSLFEAGRTAYQGARYESALRYFEDSYELSGRTALLFNIGSTLERLQRNEEALARFREYLQAMPNAPNREFVQRRIEFLEGIIAGRTETQDGETSADLVERESQGAVIVNPPPTETDQGGGSVVDEWWFWTIIAVVVAGAAAGITAGVVIGTSGVEEPLPGDFPVVMALTGTLP